MAFDLEEKSLKRRNDRNKEAVTFSLKIFFELFEGKNRLSSNNFLFVSFSSVNEIRLESIKKNYDLICIAQIHVRSFFFSLSNRWNERNMHCP